MISRLLILSFLIFTTALSNNTQCSLHAADGIPTQTAADCLTAIDKFIQAKNYAVAASETAYITSGLSICLFTNFSEDLTHLKSLYAILINHQPAPANQETYFYNLKKIADGIIYIYKDHKDLNGAEDFARYAIKLTVDKIKNDALIKNLPQIGLSIATLFNLSYQNGTLTDAIVFVDDQVEEIKKDINALKKYSKKAFFILPLVDRFLAMAKVYFLNKINPDLALEYGTKQINHFLHTDTLASLDRLVEQHYPEIYNCPALALDAESFLSIIDDEETALLDESVFTVRPVRYLVGPTVGLGISIARILQNQGKMDEARTFLKDLHADLINKDYDRAADGLQELARIGSSVELRHAKSHLVETYKILPYFNLKYPDLAVLVEKIELN